MSNPINATRYQHVHPAQPAVAQADVSIFKNILYSLLLVSIWKSIHNFFCFKHSKLAEIKKTSKETVKQAAVVTVAAQAKAEKVRNEIEKLVKIESELKPQNEENLKLREENRDNLAAARRVETKTEAVQNEIEELVKIELELKKQNISNKKKTEKNRRKLVIARSVLLRLEETEGKLKGAVRSSTKSIENAQQAIENQKEKKQLKNDLEEAKILAIRSLLDVNEAAVMVSNAQSKFTNQPNVKNSRINFFWWRQKI